MLSTLSPIIALLLSNVNVLATPTRKNVEFSMPLHRRVHSRSVEDWGVWAKKHRDGLAAKYSSKSSTKRSTGTNLITNQGIDSSYFGSLAIGTPAVSFEVILDTGSADLWLAGNTCTSCSSIPTFDGSTSSSFTNKNAPFSIVYGSGAASGTLASDTVQMAGFSVSSQVFGVCDQISNDLLSSPVSGLLGLAWDSIASSGATPFWQTLASGNAWDSPVMAFQFTRFLNQSKSSNLEAGGSFTMGFVNSTLYSGDIEYIDMPTSPSYWILPITAITVQGNSISVPSGEDSYAAIDTGTTLVGGPASEIASIYAQIPNSQAGTGNYDGYYFYPCDTSVTVTLSFGGKAWPVSPADFQERRLSRNTCLGSFFALPSSTTPAWIVGDTFLKNVYSVFRYNPPSIGFAALSEYSLSMNGNLDISVPSPTIGSVVAEATAGPDRTQVNNAKSSQTASLAYAIVAVLICVVAPNF